MDESTLLRRRLVEKLIKDDMIKTKRVEHAFLRVPREEFLPKMDLKRCYEDTPLPLPGTGQTISAPHMCAIMLEELELYPGLSVLEVGTGSGYNSALLAEMITSSGKGPSGHVTTMERIAELVDSASLNLKRLGYGDKVKVVLGDGTMGYPSGVQKEIYDRIVVTAGAPTVPRQLQIQAKDDAILLIPVGDIFSQKLTKVFKKSGGKLETKHLCECVFVPLLGSDGHPNS